MIRREEREGGRWHRMMMSIMGPAQIGPFDEVVARAPDDRTCGRCGRLQSEHEVVRDPGLTWTRCPVDPPSALATPPDLQAGGPAREPDELHSSVEGEAP